MANQITDSDFDRLRDKVPMRLNSFKETEMAMLEASNIARWSGPIELTTSESGSLHCTQACFIMAVRAILGHDITMDEAEQLTGYSAGSGTWPYKMFLSLADLGLYVVSVEVINPYGFLDDLKSEISSFVGGDERAIRNILAMTDIPQEKERVNACINNPRIDFEVRAPTVKDVEIGLSHGALPMVSLDYNVLHETGATYEGHKVLVSAMGAQQAELYDPGPPGAARWGVDIERFSAAMRSPSENAGGLILLWQEK